MILPPCSLRDHNSLMKYTSVILSIAFVTDFPTLRHYVRATRTVGRGPIAFICRILYEYVSNSSILRCRPSTNVHTARKVKNLISRCGKWGVKNWLPANIRSTPRYWKYCLIGTEDSWRERHCWFKRLSGTYLVLHKMVRLWMNIRTGTIFNLAPISYTFVKLTT